jgi:hypothetical protein
MDDVARRSGKGTWEELLTAASEALATLRAQDLEELTVRAEHMLRDATPENLSALRRAGVANLKSEHRLLGDLLLATDRNLQVLRRVCARKSGSTAAGEAHRTWAR